MITSDDKMVVGESRTELLNWLNSTLQLNYTKVENCGTGAAFCQLMDSIMGGVPMGKVKFHAKTEYDYISNFKILQSAFNKHKINKSIDIERLIKCKLQDNLLLLQWFKKFWHENKFVNEEYDPVARRKLSGVSNAEINAGGIGNGISNSLNRSRTSSGSSLNSSRASGGGGVGGGGGGGSSGGAPPPPRRVSLARTSMPPNTPATSAKVSQLSKDLVEANQQLAQAHEELQEYKILAESLETERNFYFNKLREIEVFVDLLKQLDPEETAKIASTDLMDKIQTILYSTEEGFQANEDNADMDPEAF